MDAMDGGGMECVDPEKENTTANVNDSHEEHESLSNNKQELIDEQPQNEVTEVSVKVPTNKQKILKVSPEQKKLMMEFICENPEMITHSSTVENERNLWEDLTKKLNELKPEKTQEHWKNAWYRWQASVFKRPEANLNCIEIKLKKFLTQLRSDSSGKMLISSTKPKKRLNVEEIDEILRDIEEEKYSLNLLIDENDVNILKLKSFLKIVEHEKMSSQKRMKKLNERKVYLQLKKRKIIESQNESIEILEKQLMDVERKLAENKC